jgi:cobalt-zinc-cadmium resistance protein CzcA
MLNALINWSLHNRFLVLAGTVLFAAFGVWSLQALPIDAFPDTTPAQVQINTQAPGLAPEKVERQVTFLVEQAMGGLPRLEELRSLSKFGLSQVVVTFADGTDIYFARQLVNERLASVEVPEGLPRPRLGPVATGLGEVFHYTVRSPGRSLTELRTLQDWVIRPALRTVPGQAEINIWGGLEKQYQVRIDPLKLLDYKLSFQQVADAMRANNLDVGGGSICRAGEMLLIHGQARTRDLNEIRKIVIETSKDGVPILVSDVAEVMQGVDIPMGGVTAQGQGPAVLGLGFMLMGENSHAVARKLDARLEEVKKTLPSDVEVEVVYNRTELVDHVLDTVRKNLFEGGLLVIAVLFIFLGNLRAGLIVAMAIPLSMLFAFCGMLRFGIAGSLLSLGAIDFGLIVDSSVVMIENVVRHLAHDQNREKNHLNAVRDAAIEVRKPTMFGELIIMIVYLPILTLEGVEGKLFRPMALTVVFALAGSLVMSLTLMPVLASLMLPRRMRETDPLIVRFARWLYAPVLRYALHHKLTVVLLMAASLLAGVMLARDLRPEFMPRLSEEALVVNILRLPGTDLKESMEYNTRMERMLLKEFPDEIAHVWARAGTAEVATDPMGTEETDFFITLKPRSKWSPEIRTQDQLQKKIEDLFKDLPGQRLVYTQPIEQRLNEMIAGAKSDVAVHIYGDEFTELKKAADRVVEILRGVRGNEGAAYDPISGQPVLQIQLLQDEIARHGVSARFVLDLVESLGSKPLGEIIESELRYPLVVRLPEKYRGSPEAIRKLLVLTPSGEQVPLERLAKIDVIEGPAKINREQGRRRVTVQCNVREREIVDFVAEAKDRIDAEVTPKLPSSRYFIEWGGQFENYERARNRLVIVVPVALVLIFGLLYITYNRIADVLLVFTGVPFACIGGVLALWLREMPFSISAAVGFIALSGVSVLNSMVLVTFIRQLRSQGVSLDLAVEGAALTRLRPVLMTALVASLGFVPMALSTGVGAEVQRPLATVVIGGVLSSTLLTLVFLPVLYRIFGPRGMEAAHEA